ncbi:lytic transglycosylase [Xenorhabdus bovienii]|uniref:lytic transglycosylase n=1 Tax=Xenorhabdus bovienii TaxID=40576 RepID=UPI0023B21979|nr:lytic transglycosylase [Xenorhabdus bovienii]MDE9432795.1 lytic transglycosylase [Xenorhabdus bovienii]MDE9490571.1 lytic transglycosylase [Xenorhabdus bovienii]MDE9507262.1 lytic transglycosylase [Xenorhabdus bovienii]
MSNNAETIRDFLISLGFEVDGAGEKKFSTIVAGVTGNVLKLGAAVEGAALAVVGFTAQVASGLDKLYWQAQRTGGTAEQIKALGYAMHQAGGSVEGLNSSLEGVAKFLRNNPGGEGFLRNMGIQTRDTNGKLRDTASLVALVGERLSAMPYYRANQYAGILGIDENTLMAMRRGIGGYASDYQRIMKTMGYNPTAAAKHANIFMTELYKLKTVMGTAKDKIGGELARVLTPSMTKFTNLILKHWPTIEKIIMSVVKAILTLSEMLGQLVFRGAKGIQDLISWWKRLDEGSQNLIKIFGLVAAAWWALNLKFLASPIGIITALAAALFLLYDDYMTWKEGGKSLIDWSKWEGPLTKVKAEIKELTRNFKELGTEILKLLGIDPKKWSLKFEFDDLAKSLGELSKTLSHLLAALNHLNDGNFTLAWEELKQAWNGDETNKRDVRPVGIDAAERHREAFINTLPDWYISANNWLNGLLGMAPFIPAKSENAGSNQSTGNTRGERNNNPLNIEYAKQRGATVEDHPEQRFAKFNTVYDGLERTAWQLRRYFNGLTDGVKRQSVAEIVEKWAPPGKKDNNRTEDYIQRVAQRLGVGRNDRLDLNNHDVMYALMNAMSQNEIGKPLPYSRDLIMAAIAGAPAPAKALAKNSNFNFDPRMFDNATANINNMLSHTGYTPKRLELLANNQPNQTTIAPYYNINVNGVDSPHEAAALTGESVQRANAILVRNLQTKVS